MPLPRRIPKLAKRAGRWRSQAHCNFVRSHECCRNGCDGRPIEVAHVRLGSGAGMSQKPDDFRTVSLCQFHHSQQHRVGEQTFWKGFDVEGMIADFIKSSPRRAQIEAEIRDRNHG